MKFPCKRSPNQMLRDVKTEDYPANTRRCFDVDSTSFERYGCQMDVETTLCAYWVTLVLTALSWIGSTGLRGRLKPFGDTYKHQFNVSLFIDTNMAIMIRTIFRKPLDSILPTYSKEVHKKLSRRRQKISKIFFISIPYIAILF